MVKIRLRRMGSSKRPVYRVVVSDSQRTPTSAVLEEVGFYDPRSKPVQVKLNRDRIEFWVGRGAQLSETVRSLLKHANA